jgi:threonine dehydrogenase-like Zn-dependent dehydrogenase
MNALFARSPFQFQLRQLDVPKPGDGEVLVKVHACGLCGTDLHFAADWSGDFMPLGHEIAGEIVELGPGVVGHRPGDKVIVEDVGMCGVCEACKNGHADQCRNNYNLKGQPGMAEYMAVSQHLLNRFDGLDYVPASLTEPLAVALNAVLHAEIPLGGDVVVYGPGPIGLMCVRLARLQGAARVALIGSTRRHPREAARMKVGEALGASQLIYGLDEDPVAAVRAIFPNGADRVIVTSPPCTLPLAVPMSRFGGLVSFIGINLGGKSKVELDVNDLIFNKVTLRPTFAEPGIKFPVSLRLLEQGMIDAGRLITHTFTFAEAERIFRMSSEGKEPVIKAVLVP